MREHQIVINLKPEQFEELQRMARAAGSKSVNLFVRQKLISTLGLAGPGNGSPDESDAPDLKQLTGELRRLHRELQIFVADSLSNSDYPTSIQPIPFPTAVQENFLAEGAPLMAESVGFTYREDPQTELTRPQLPGAFPPSDRPQYSNFQAPITQAATPQPADFGAPQVVSSGQSESASPTEVNSRLQPAYSLLPDPGAAASVAGAAAPPAFSPPEAPPEVSSAQHGLNTPSVSPSNTIQSAPIVVQQFAENDELEDLAERAFSISPRLGPLEEPQKRFPDPLADLLEEALFEDSEDTVEEYAEASESESAASDDELVDAAEVEPGGGRQVLELEHSDSTVDNAIDEPAEIEEPVLEDANETIEEESEVGPEELESRPGADDEPPPDDTPPDPPLQFPPPISGGPPPRKRRT